MKKESIRKLAFYVPVLTILVFFGFFGKSHGEFLGVNIAFGYGGGGGGGGMAPYTTTYQTRTNDPNRVANLQNLVLINVPIHALVKLQDDGKTLTQEDSSVYYVGADGKRHAFPNDKVYFSWYKNFSAIVVITPEKLASIPLGANGRYKPGVRLVKFTTDPKVYVVSLGGQLRWIQTEVLAKALYGDDWNTKIDDLSDSFYVNYSFGAPIAKVADYNLGAQMTGVDNISTDLGF